MINTTKKSLHTLNNIDMNATVALLQKVNLFSLYKGKLTKRGVDELIDSSLSLLTTEQLIQINSSAINLTRNFNVYEQSWKNYTSTYNNLFRKINDYLAEIENLKQQRYDKLQDLKNTPTTQSYTFDKYTAEYAELKEQIDFLQARVNEFKKLLPPTTIRKNKNTQDENLIVIKKQLVKLAKQIDNAINDSLDPTTQQTEFNTLFNLLPDNEKIKFYQYPA